jgi:molybdenum cofactor cytidylyltransferase
MELVGILLAAGRGRRFDPSAQRLKLLETGAPGAPADGMGIAAAAALALRAAVGPVVAVVRADDAPQQQRLRAQLAAAGCRFVTWSVTDGAEGMGTSIACGVAASATAGGWIIALADMPDVQPASIAAVGAAIAGGAASAAPYFQGRRGHPVGFGAVCGPYLAALRGDDGARALLERYPPVRIDVDDPGVLRDIDTPADL